ncbi:MAG: helix-turn-helix transcriptional regulator [Kiritimatiellae bacterium]|nr:helix-turn-helix transcriptional regulator [Kiritimatiellia bacterium]
MSAEFQYVPHPKRFADPTFRGVKSYKGYPELMKQEFRFPLDGYTLVIRQLMHRILEDSPRAASLHAVNYRLEYCVAGRHRLLGHGREIDYAPGRLFVFTHGDRYRFNPAGRKNLEQVFMEFNIEDHALRDRSIQEIEAIHTVRVPQLYVDLSLSRRREFERCLFEIVRAVAERPPSYPLRVREQLLAAFSLCMDWDVIRIEDLRKASVARHWHHYLWVEKARRFVHERYADKIALGDIGRHTGVDPDYLNRLFRAETGKSLKHYLNELRIDRAKTLFREGETDVTGVGLAVGFQSPSYFSVKFKAATGRPPKAYVADLLRGE